MRRFKNILAVYGDSIGADNVLDRAEELAQANDADLTLIEVLPERYTTPQAAAERQKKLERVAKTLKKQGVRSITMIGTPFLDIIRTVLKNRHDLVIIAADSGSTMRNLYFGSSARHLMRKCPCPVWVLQPTQTKKARRILACVDPVSDSPYENELDTTILELSTSLSVMKQAELHIVNVWDVTGKDRDTIQSEVRDEDYQRILDRHKNIQKGRVMGLLDKQALEGINYTLHFPRNSPHAGIVNLAESLDIELIVMGTISRSGISGFLIGNSAETILSCVRSSVFTVKPKGFLSPVTLH